MSCEDETDPRKNEKLIAHLSNEDFFAVAQHPEAVLEIFKLVPIAKAKEDEVNYFVFAKLSIRGKTNDIKFPARINLEKDLITANASFDIDRTQWDIRYGSGSFFENLGDRAINNEISFKVKIIARRQ
jgi:polyisoprenoid-binding protein YceI